jgi:hypothetical protein
LLKDIRTNWTEYKVSVHENVGKLKSVTNNGKPESIKTFLESKMYLYFGDHLKNMGWLPRQNKRRLLLFDGSENELKDWRVMTDEQFGGSSEATLSINETVEEDKLGNEQRAYSLVFSGYLRSLPQKDDMTGLSSLQKKLFIKNHANAPDLATVDGFAGCESPKAPLSQMGDFDAVVMKVQTCGRAWRFNVANQDVFSFGDDMYVAQFPPEKPTPARLRYMKWIDMLHTGSGMPKANPRLLNPNDITAFGFAIRGEEGPFRLELHWLEARRSKFHHLSNNLLEETDPEEKAMPHGMKGLWPEDGDWGETEKPKWDDGTQDDLDWGYLDAKPVRRTPEKPSKY